MSIQTTTPAAELALSVEDAKAHLRITGSDDDDLIEAYIYAAIQSVENFTGRSLITQTVTLTLDKFPASREILLEKSPIQSVTSVSYIDGNEASQTYSSASYSVDDKGEPGRIVLKEGYTWPTTSNNINAVSIVYITGFGEDSSDIPYQILLALKLLVGHFYQNREILSTIDMKEIPKTFEFLVLPYKVFSWRG